jgi:hypothetical protein
MRQSEKITFKLTPRKNLKKLMFQLNVKLKNDNFNGIY